MRRAGHAVPLLALLVLAAGCGARSQRSDPARAPRAPTPVATSPTASPSAAPESASASGPVLRGRATYYSDRLAGRRTANGERYEPSALTAAHRSLPFGTELEVSRDDGRSVRVRVNDRGPFGKAAARGVIIDLSRRAAERLGMIRAGIVDVTVRIVKTAAPRAGSTPPRRDKPAEAPPDRRLYAAEDCD